MAITPSTPAVETRQEEQRRSESFAAVDFDGVRESFDASRRTPDDTEPNRSGFGLGGAAGAGVAALLPLVMGAAEASAKGGQFGIIEGKTASFLHPIIMVSDAEGRE